MATISLLTRVGCAMCERARIELEPIAAEFGVTLDVVDVDAPEHRELRAEYGDMLPVVLLDGEEHGYWEVDTVRLRADLGALRG